MENKVLVSENLLMFLVEWLEWATSEDPEGGKFKKYLGLCHCYSVWIHRNRKDVLGVQCLKVALSKSRLDTAYPFGRDNFLARMGNDTQHLDPDRIAWVRKVIKDNREVAYHAVGTH